jgi:hypothetical protein
MEIDQSWQTKLATSQKQVEGYKKISKDLEAKQLKLTDEFVNLQKKYQALYLSKLDQKTESPAVDQPHMHSAKRPRTGKPEDEETTNSIGIVSELETPSSKRLRVEAEPFVPQGELSELAGSHTMEILEESTAAPEVTEPEDQTQEELEGSPAKDLDEELDEDEQSGLNDEVNENEDDIEPYEETEDVENQVIADEIMYAAEVTDEHMEALKGLIPSGTNLGTFNA